MKGVVRSLLLFLCTTLFIMSASVCVCVVRVHADASPTYAVMDEFCNVIADNGSRQFQAYIRDDLSEVRGIILATSSSLSDARFYTVSENSYSKSIYNNADSACKTELSSMSTTNVGSSGYAVSYTGAQPTRFKDHYLIPVVIDPTLSDARAIYYTFGEGAVAPEEDPPDYDLVDIIGYQTNVRGNGEASVNNVDVISWNPLTDTAGNDISEGNVRIRIIPGEYQAETKNSLIQKLYTDFILDVVHATDGHVYSVSTGKAELKWSDTISELQLPFMSWASMFDRNGAWIKRGWIYEIRLEIDNYIGEWQPIYSSTSSGVNNDLTIVNCTVIDQDVLTAIQNINNLNNTTNIWIIIGTPVDPDPVKPEEDEDEKPWWLYLLEMINNALGLQNEYISEGTDESIEIVNNFEEDHDDLNVTVNDYDDIENDLVIDMNNNLEQIEVESDLIENNGFLNSARWVAEQYTTLTTDNPIGSILKFSLVLGFVMIFLGRFK